MVRIIYFLPCLFLFDLLPLALLSQALPVEDSLADLSLLPKEREEVVAQELDFEGWYASQPIMAELAAQEHILEDSVVINVFRRKLLSWQEAVLVCDWTESMYPYGLQALSWINYFRESSHQVRSWVFFNDGDAKTMGEKVIGQTQGIYSYAGDELEPILELMHTVKQAGRGDDAPENDLEALMHAQRVFPDCKHLILIADAGSEVRDMLLLEALKRALKQKDIQLHIILCGASKGVTYDYLALAHACNASLHVSARDWEGLESWVEGQEIELGNKKYRLEDGYFKMVYPSKKRR